nr:probable ubiquitin-conjugating enzyme E2 23 isoform X1 [Ipomoea trifida]
MEAGGIQDASNVDVPAMTTKGNCESQQGDSISNGRNCDPNMRYICKPDDVLRNLKNVSYIFRQDVVKSKTDGKIGIVTEAPADQVRVLWMDETESIQSINDVTVIDRGFLPGDYIAAVADPTGQVGLVVDINISVNLLTHDGSFVKDISTRELKRVRDFTVGDYVVLGPWLGRIDDVLDNVTVLFDDGTLCKVMKADPLRLKPVGRNSLEDGSFPYYPGQRVKAISSSVFKNSRWLSGFWKASRLEGTVTKVTVGSVFIYWIASAGYGPDSSTPPAQEQSPKNLKLISCFAHANWQLGDWCLLPSPPPSSSNLLEQGLTKLDLSDSTKEEASESAQTGADCDSEESHCNSESIDNDADSSMDWSCDNLENKVPLESSSSVSTLHVSKEPIHESWPIHRRKIRRAVVRRDKKARKKEENFERALLIVNTKSRVDVAWQDGTIERGLESTSLIPIDNPGDHEFVAEQYVVEKAADDAEGASETRRVGVLKSVNAKERTACVRWLKPVTRAEDLKEFDKEEMVSVYELEGHPDYDYCYGDVVVRLSSVPIPAQVNSSESPIGKCKQQGGPNEVKEDQKMHLGCKNDGSTLSDESCTQFSDLSWVGNIIGLKNGDIEVMWADGMISTFVQSDNGEVGPQAIYVVGRDDDESMAASGSDISDDAASWETVEDDELNNTENPKEDLGAQSATDISIETDGSLMDMENSGVNGALATAFGFVSRLASGIFSRERKKTDSPSSDSRSEDEIQIQGWDRRMDTGDDKCCQRPSDMECIGTLSIEKREDNVAVEAIDPSDVAETLSNMKAEPTNASVQHKDGAYAFKNFDITTDPHDHYFVGATAQNNAGRKWLRKVQQDWIFLQNNLPDGIFVRVYEDRMDLMRAVIVGAYGTPYQDGLFFFDFHLPPEYPDIAPSAYYHSGGWRVNPNLYEEGKVCLSLLNTWTGRGNEIWDPSSSSIFQVLVSLQGLVLNARPYFNEAGYDKQIGTAEGEKNSLSYNENTFLLNCKTMMYLMRKPLKDFEELVKEHFRRRGYYILKACDAYMKGYLIGSLTPDASVSSNSNADANSVGFKLMLAKIAPKLFLALSEIGADCEEFKHLLHSAP